ncbi:MAG TPA: DUF4012 domain-containing protein [Jatrophihabitans sp.]|nr:DUF4012 domain-containing protein [Jatrophihabitans sp.]
MSTPGDATNRPRGIVRSIWLIVLGVLLLAVLWLAITAVLARERVATVHRAVSALRTAVDNNDVPAAQSDAKQAAAAAHSAHRLTTGPAWWAASQVPWLGRPAETARVCAEQTDVLGRQVLIPLAQIGDKVTLSKLVDHGRIELTPLLEARPVLDGAASALHRSTQRIDMLPHHTWLPLLDSARTTLQTSLTKLSRQLTPLSQAADVLPEMLGQSGTKRYFVGLENEAESRGVGGIPGAFAIVTASNGKIAFQEFESDTTLAKVRTGLNLGAQYAALYRSADPTNVYPNSTISPDFSNAARIWAAMWQKYSGQAVDGAMAIDPTAISYLLKVTGPAKLADGTQVTADNVVSLTQKSLYQSYPDTTARKRYLLSIADAISLRLLQAHGSTSLVRAIARGASERRVLVWSADPQIERRLAAFPIAGGLSSPSGYYAGFVTVNATGGKLDYYIVRDMDYRRTGCSTSVVSTSTFTLTNAVPPGPLPSYVTIRADNPSGAVRPGDNRVLLSYYGTPGSRITALTIDGQAQLVAQTAENGLALVIVPVELPRGHSVKVVVTASEPAQPPDAGTTILRQPAAQPVRISETLPACR